MNVRIGILGGMGPRATVQFEQLLLERLPGTDQDIPPIITINDGAIPDRSDYILGIGEDPVPRLKQNLHTLLQAKASVICAPCNTVCAPVILHRLQQQTTTPIIDLPFEVGRHLRTKGYKKIFLLATEGTLRAGVYQDITLRVGVACIEPEPALQKVIMQLIRAVKTNDMRLARQCALMVRPVIRTSGCEAVILGCTELPCLKALLVPQNCVAIDTLEILANACVAHIKYATVAAKER